MQRKRKVLQNVQNVQRAKYKTKMLALYANYAQNALRQTASLVLVENVLITATVTMAAQTKFHLKKFHALSLIKTA